MNVLFLTLCEYHSINERDIYTDLLREFIKNGDQVYMISPIERRNGKDTYIINEEHSTIIRLRIGNIQKTNIIEKGLSTIMIEPEFKRAIRKYLSNIKFDLILYSTPPITLVSAIEYVKKKDQARTYLLLKDIFPQNAVDMGMMKEGSVLHSIFRRKEKHLYEISDFIGCMSQANVDYVIGHNPQIDPEIVEICPNSIEIIDKSVDKDTRDEIRKKYGIPTDKKVFIYGGNLGKPQGIPFMLECIKACKDEQDILFLIIGDGTEYGTIEKHIQTDKQANLMLMKRLPKDDYDTMVGACDAGMIFLDHRFTIPNFPSRLLSYMQAKIPVLACTDTSSDIGKIITEHGFGWYCESNDIKGFTECIRQIREADLNAKGTNSWNALIELYDAEKAYGTIIRRIKGA